MMGIPYTGSGVSACIRAADKVLAKHAMRDAGIPTPDFYAFNETAFRELGAAEALPGDRGAAGVPDRGQARRAGLGAGDQVRAHGRRRARQRWWPRSPMTARCCSSATWPAATWPCRSIERRRRRRRCRSSRRCPSRRTSTTSSRATRSGGPGSCARPRSTTSSAARAQAIALDVYRLLGCSGFARVDLMLESTTRRAVRARGQPDPRADRDEPAAPGRGGGAALASTS